MDLGAAPEPAEAAEATGSPADEIGREPIPPGPDLRDLATMIQGALQQGNATANVDGHPIDLPESGLRGVMFEPLGSDADPEDDPEEK